MRCKKYLEKNFLSCLVSEIQLFVYIFGCLKFWDNKNFWGAKCGPPSPATSVNIHIKGCWLDRQVLAKYHFCWPKNFQIERNSVLSAWIDISNWAGLVSSNLLSYLCKNLGQTRRLPATAIPAHDLELRYY